MEWPQARLPFGDLELEYIKGLDLDRDVALLRDVLHISESCRRLAWAAGRLLQIFAENGRTAYDIGKVLYRDDFDAPSPFERLLEACTKEASPDLADPLIGSFDLTEEVPDFQLTVKAYSSPPVTHRYVRKPFPMLSPSVVEKDDEKMVTSATPSTRSSSPLFGTLMALDLPDLADLPADQYEKPPKSDRYELPFELECWSPESTTRFRQSIEDGLQQLLQHRG
jgi:hypothetical protein